jgi:CBS domain-containing protein
MMMLDHNSRHLPLTEDGQVIGVITQSDVLRQQSYSPIFLPQQLKRARTMEDLRDYSDSVTDTVGALLDAGARIRDIGRVVAIAHDALLQRLLADAEAELGPPPCAYAWMVLGSEGRYEQTLRTDQDNAMIYADDAPPDADDYLSQLANRVVDQLVECGFPRCPGDVMATNPRWRQPLHVWQRYFEDWIRVPDEEALLRVGIFFDYRQVYGTLPAEAGLRPIIDYGREQNLFMTRFARAALQHAAPLNFFRRFVRESDGVTHDLIDLKHRGTAPIVDLARLFALEAGCTATNTLTRLEMSAARHSLSETGAEDLAAAFEMISQLRLVHQYSQWQQGIEATNLVSLAELTPREKRELKNAFLTLDTMQRNVMYIFKLWNVE